MPFDPTPLPRIVPQDQPRLGVFLYLLTLLAGVGLFYIGTSLLLSITEVTTVPLGF